MEMMYVAMSAVELNESMALNAVDDPMLIKLITVVKSRVKMTELTGMCHLGCTAPSQPEKGSPWSRAKAKVCVVLVMFWHCVVTTYLSRSARRRAYCDHGQKKQNHNCQTCCPRCRAGSLLEDIDEGEA